MSVISISIIESTEQIISGIPRSVTISANIPSSIFYTLDGTDPTLFSTIYTGAIVFTTSSLSITLKVFATNGSDNSPIITEVYSTDVLNNARLPHSSTTAEAQSIIPNAYPFGTPESQPNSTFLNPGDAGTNVNDPSLPQIPNGFDGNHNPNNFTNLPFNTENYLVQYSTTDSIGQMGRGIGTLPANVKIELEKADPEESQAYTNLFDPRAMVIFQDVDNEDQSIPPIINRQFFALENSNRVRDGNNYLNAGPDSPTFTAAFTRSHYNPRTNEISYYYYDSLANRWIISKAQFKPTGTFDGNMAGQFFSRKGGPGAHYVQAWRPFARRVLF